MAESTLYSEIESQSDVDFAQGRKNHLSDLFCSIGGIFASLVAAILAATPGVCGWIAAIVALIPGSCALLQRIVDFRGRAAWYFLKSAKEQSIALALRYEGMEEKEASRQFRDLIIEMENKWSDFVKAGSTPVPGQPQP